MAGRHPTDSAQRTSPPWSATDVRRHRWTPGHRVCLRDRLWFDGDDRSGRKPLFGSTITLGEEFYQSIVAAPVPVDTRALAALAGSPMKMDLLVWFSHRLGYVRKTHMVPWALLAEQFGAEYSRARDFRADISKALREVLIVYPGANVQITDGGLLLSPSRTAIPRLA